MEDFLHFPVSPRLLRRCIRVGRVIYHFLPPVAPLMHRYRAPALPSMVTPTALEISAFIQDMLSMDASNPS
jgi:hypothetical protein